MKQCQEIKQNWTRQEDFEIFLLRIFFDHPNKHFICEREPTIIHKMLEINSRLNVK